MNPVIFPSSRSPAGATDEPPGRAERGGTQDAFASLLAELDVRTAPAEAPPMGRARDEGAPVRPQGLTGRMASAAATGEMREMAAALVEGAAPPETASSSKGPLAAAPEPPAAERELAALLARPAAGSTEGASRPPPQAALRVRLEATVLADAGAQGEGAAVQPDVLREVRTEVRPEVRPDVKARAASPSLGRAITPAPALSLALPGSPAPATEALAPGALSPAQETPPAPAAPVVEESVPAAPDVGAAAAPSISLPSAAMIGALGPVSAPGLEEEGASAPSTGPLALVAPQGDMAPDEAALPAAKVVLCETHFAPVTPRDLRAVAAMPSAALPSATPPSATLPSAVLPPANMLSAAAAMPPADGLRVPAPEDSPTPLSRDGAAAATPAVAVEADMPASAPRPPLAALARLGARESTTILDGPSPEGRAETLSPLRDTARAERREATRFEREAPALATGGTAPAAILPTAPPLPGAAPSPAAVQLGAAIAEAVRADVPPAPLPGEAAQARGPVRILEIQLHPVELGLVTVRLRTGRNGLEIHVHAARAETARLLEQDRSSLLATLVEADAGPLDLTISQTGMPAPLTGDDAFAPVERDRPGGDEPRDGQPGDSDPRRKRQQNGQAPFRAADSGAAD
ncbi:flagellar hook-length control protein FliK [Ancylobacter sp. FA202]|uniref:flagellar hook-length control protein FliK n=1 Tax=Ancylobacter sp. FA202 TaxID=1111106 RepID=UPI0003A4A790|nr:flagellar hook-length control protein FliK [Ancylobacter sp. FA202]